MHISDWRQDVNANTIYMKDSFDSERLSGGFTPFYLDCSGGCWDHTELKRCDGDGKEQLMS